MPTIVYDKRELKKLIGKDLSDEKLKQIIESIKPSVESITKDEIEIEHTPDRPDLFSVEGLARAIRLFLGLKPKKMKIKKARLTVKSEKVSIRPYIACAIVRNINLTNSFILSLMKTQEVLNETFGRKRKKVAIGIHDFDKIKPPIVYRPASREEKFQPLGESKEMSLIETLFNTEKGQKYKDIIINARKFPVFSDSLGIFSFPPILNSERTKVTEKTRNIFIDITGTDRRAVTQTLNLLIYDFVEHGATIEAVKIKSSKELRITPEINWRSIQISIEEANKLLGLNITEEKAKKLLKKMGYKVIDREVLIPPYRVDILHPVDIYEDLAIAYGYENIKPELPNIFTKGEFHSIEALSDKIRNLMVGFGFTELMRPVLTNETKQFRKMNIEEHETIKVVNPVSSEYTQLRVWLIPSLLEVLSKNTHVSYPQKVFEIGDVVIPDKKEETKSKTVRHLSAAIASTDASYALIKGIVEKLLKYLGYNDVKMAPLEHKSFIKGRCSKVLIKGKQVGFLGEIHPLVLENWKIEMPVAAFEIELPPAK